MKPLIFHTAHIARIAPIIAIFLFLCIPALTSTALAANSKFSWDVPVQNLQVYQHTEYTPDNIVRLQWQTHTLATNEGSFFVVVSEDEPLTLDHFKKGSLPFFMGSKSGGYAVDARGKMYGKRLDYPFQDGHTYWVGVGTSSGFNKDKGQLYSVNQALKNQQKITFTYFPNAEKVPHADDTYTEKRLSLLDEKNGLLFEDAPAPWKDTADTAWATGINYIYNKGIEPEYFHKDGLYSPDASMRRYDFIASMLRHKFGIRIGVYNKNPQTECGYEDWWSDEGKTALCHAKEIFHLDKMIHHAGRFEHDKNITLADALTVMVPYLFVDFDVKADIKDYVKRAAEQELIPHTVQGLTSELTKGEVADMLARAYFIQDGNIGAYELMAKTDSTVMTYTCLRRHNCPAKAQPTKPIDTSARKWAVVFTYRELPMPQSKVSLLCKRLLPQIPKWFKKEANKNGAAFELELTCLQKQLELPEELDTMHFQIPPGENDGSYIERPLSPWHVSEFLKKPPYDQYNFVTFFHYIPYEYPLNSPAKNVDERAHIIIVQKALDGRDVYLPKLETLPTFVAQELAGNMGASDIRVPADDTSCQDLMCQGPEIWAADRVARQPLKKLRITEKTAPMLGW